MCYVYELLNDRFNIAAFFYNPNIMPTGEYRKRRGELLAFSRLKQFPLITEDTGINGAREWVQKVKPFRELGEKSERCRECYSMRLKATFQRAAEEKYDIVATTLSISPHKNAGWINETGTALSSEYGVSFYEADFKKKDGFKKSAALSRELGFYRQDYCGCVYSMLERDPESRWSKRLRSRDKIVERPADTEALQLDPGEELDLHHFNPADTEKLVDEYLRIAIEKGYTKIRIVHGKGKSRVKQRVYRVLANHPVVNSFHDDSYNWGATVVELAPFTLC